MMTWAESFDFPSSVFYCSSMQVFSVSAFVSYVNETFKAIWDPNEVAVEGEVSGYRLSQGQWATFDLKDQDSLVNVFCPVWKLGIPITDGVRVRVYGNPRIYAKYGKFSLSAERVEIVGEGELRKALAFLRQKLEAEGLFELSRKRELPRFPQKVALIASRESAAYGDFIRILKERWGGLEVDLYHVLVQGDRAPEGIVRAVMEAGRNPAYDVLVMTRGGGSLEELMAFNDERVVRALYASKVPTLVAIGHERDVTLAEEVADVRGSTPTDCARRLVPDRTEVLYEIATNMGRAEQGMVAMVEEGKVLVDRAIGSADRWQKTIHERLMTRRTDMVDKATRWLERWKERRESLERLLSSFDPRNVVKRGFAVVRDRSGKVRTALAGLYPGAGIQIEMSDGWASALVESIQKNGYAKKERND
jgi:exodeoxyribonuclease VII large subunit